MRGENGLVEAEKDKEPKNNQAKRRKTTYVRCKAFHRTRPDPISKLK